MKKLTVFLSVILTLMGCSATGPVFKPVEVTPEGQATVYIYRPHVFFNRGGWPEIFVNNEKLFALKNQGYGVVYLHPGDHKIRAEGSFFTNWYPGPMEISHSFEADKEYYIRVTPQMTSAMLIGNVMSMAGKANVSIVQKEIAKNEISETRRVY